MKRLMTTVHFPLAFATGDAGSVAKTDTKIDAKIDAKAPGAAAGNNTASAAAAKDRVAPVVTAVRTDVPMPEVRARGSKSAYPFDTLTAIGNSFGVKNKTAAQIATIVANANKKGVQPKKDANGNPIMKNGEPIKDASGAIVGYQPGTSPETEVVKHFFASDCDASTDPDGASVRVFRDK